MDPQHDHAPTAACQPSCPGWEEGALSLLKFQRRYPEMLEACRAAAAISFVDVAPGSQGVVLPQYLMEDDVVRLNLVVGSDTPEVLLDEWGIRCRLTFRGQHHACAFPWPSILGGTLVRPARRRPRFGVIEGADDVPVPVPVVAEPAPPTGPAEPGPEAAPPRPSAPRRFGVIEGGKGKKD